MLAVRRGGDSSSSPKCHEIKHKVLAYIPLITEACCKQLDVWERLEELRKGREAHKSPKSPFEWYTNLEKHSLEEEHADRRREQCEQRDLLLLFPSLSNHSMGRYSFIVSREDEEEPPGDSIGSTVYSKHWFFSTLTKLIDVVTADKDKPVEGEEASVELDEDTENDFCKVWDMTMNEEVAQFLVEFNAAEIFLGVITKSKCNRLTEICVGILGNMACFQETCLNLSSNKDLGEVLLLLLSDTDPPTLLETCRLLLTCLSQVEVMSMWLERIRKHPSIRDNLCFIMTSSTNADLLVKVGELVDKLFDVDEDIMVDWIKAGCQQPGTPITDIEEEKPPPLGLVPSLLEAAKELKDDSPEGLDVYMHILQLVTTVDEGIQSIVQSPEDGKRTWEFLFELTCRHFCQPDDPPLLVQEHKTILSSILAVMSVMFSSQTEMEYAETGKNLPLINSLTRILENLEACWQKSSDKLHDGGDPEDGAIEEDFHLKILKDVCCEFLSNILSQLTKENISEALKQGHITEKKCLCALQNLLPLYSLSVNSFLAVLGEADQDLSETLRKEMTTLREEC
ncbi:PREDICTED: protein SAAL1 [Nanorana parkeri]|uniref:protein SAAL1 n=1 Tax=Nanorana parkeri TaxID=125878 RepID=UPI0008545F63|nr:PREDICTED: protein SAAL1 [Nanorana parkeri]